MISLVIERMPPLNLLQSLTQKLECRLAPAWELARRDQSEVFPRLSLLEHKTSRLSMHSYLPLAAPPRLSLDSQPVDSQLDLATTGEFPSSCRCKTIQTTFSWTTASPLPHQHRRRHRRRHKRPPSNRSRQPKVLLSTLILSLGWRWRWCARNRSKAVFVRTRSWPV